MYVASQSAGIHTAFDVYSMTCLANMYSHGYEHGVLARRDIGSLCNPTTLSPRLYLTLSLP